jgi:hypothetical protein
MLDWYWDLWILYRVLVVYIALGLVVFVLEVLDYRYWHPPRTNREVVHWREWVVLLIVSMLIGPPTYLYTWVNNWLKSRKAPKQTKPTIDW